MAGEFDDPEAKGLEECAINQRSDTYPTIF